VTIETKQVVQFGQQVTLYRVISPDGWSTLWHSSREKALAHYKRRYYKRRFPETSSV
jgi:hypothetical protein